MMCVLWNMHSLLTVEKLWVTWVVSDRTNHFLSYNELGMLVQCWQEGYFANLLKKWSIITPCTNVYCLKHLCSFISRDVCQVRIGCYHWIIISQSECTIVLVTYIIILKLQLSVCACMHAFVLRFSGGRLTSTLWSPLWTTKQTGSNGDGVTDARTLLMC